MNTESNKEKVADISIWKTINIGDIGDNESIFEQEIDLVCINESLLNCHNWELEERARELGLQMCPPGLASCLALMGELPEEIDKICARPYGLFIGHKPILRFKSGIGCPLYVYRLSRNSERRDIRGNPFRFYTTEPLEISFISFGRSYYLSASPGLANKNRNWLFIKPRK